MSCILLLLDHTEQTRLLAKWLEPHQIMESERAVATNEPFDLCITDGASLEQHWEWAQSVRAINAPFYLPFVLTTNRQEVRQATSRHWSVVDELLFTPIDQIELQTRVEKQLWARDSSIALAKRNNQLEQANHSIELLNSAQAALERENAHLTHKAQEAIHTRDMLFSIAAHELRTPLTSLLGYANLLERRLRVSNSLSERDRRAVQMVSLQSLRLSKMIDSLLDISRIQDGQLQLEPALLDISLLAQRVIEELQPVHEDYHFELLLPNQPLMILGDELRLEQVLYNLFHNAIKYSPGSDAITILVEQRGDQVALDVIDHGIGIPQHEVRNLFQRFFRASNVDQQQIGGMGIGLFIVKEIVTLHGGSVSVSSTLGRGSTFSVLLPLQEQARAHAS